MTMISELPDLLVFSHLRWDFVFQRPQHLLLRHAEVRRVYYFEEPIFGSVKQPEMRLRMSAERVTIVTPFLPEATPVSGRNEILRRLVNDVIADENIAAYASWYYTPMALEFTRHLKPKSVIYDCMDELSAFKGAPPAMLDMESELLRKADVVFTGGHSLFEAKKHRHANIHPFPSSIDYKHFAKARVPAKEPADQRKIPHPRLGFFGVIDERFDIRLLKEMAVKKPTWHFVIVGPVVKIDPNSLPVLPNIHYLGKKEYSALPEYLADWDCAIMPFAINESTKYISPTKTPEFLAAGRPVVSTPIRDVVRPYARQNLVRIAATSDEFIKACVAGMHEAKNDAEWLVRVDEFLSASSWDMTYRSMLSLERGCYRKVSPRRNDSPFTGAPAIALSR